MLTFTHSLKTPNESQLIIFDWDGTLFDSTAAIAHSLSRAVHELGLGEVSEHQARQVIGLGFAEATQALVGEVSATTLNAFVAKYRQYYFADEHALVLYEGILPLLQTLKMHNKYLAVATGKSRMGLNRLLNIHPEISRLFDSTRTADETASKPHPLMLQELLDEHSMAAEQAVMVGDTQFDIEMAHAAQIRSIAVTYGAHSIDDLRRANPDVMVHDVAQLAQCLLPTSADNEYV